MLANILVEPGRIELREIDTPAPSTGELLIRIKAALTCGTDLKAFRRGHPLIPMPGLFGHEFSGIVAKTGKGVRRFKEGDAIMTVHSAPCLTCKYCKKKLFNLCEHIMNSKALGAFAEYIVLPSHIVRMNAFLKPGFLSFEEAAFLEPLSCVVHSMASLNIKKGDHALIIGSGPIGLLHLLLLKEKGALVTVLDKHAKKLRTAGKLGADMAVRKEQKEAAGAIKPSADFIGFDFVFECTGTPEVWEESVRYVRRGGTVILFGGCRSGTKVTYDTCRLHYDEITVKGVFHFTPEDVKKAYALLCKKSLGVSQLISGRYTLKGTRHAFEKLAGGEGIKYAVIPSGEECRSR
jgi:L-iditol 2-dehydrogenase